MSLSIQQRLQQLQATTDALTKKASILQEKHQVTVNSLKANAIKIDNALSVVGGKVTIGGEEIPKPGQR